MYRSLRMAWSSWGISRSFYRNTASRYVAAGTNTKVELKHKFTQVKSKNKFWFLFFFFDFYI